ncbi:hypothetical protein [Streptomyces hoynatensis]|uniref:Uncharacterized protein n=1 Tax=Streptomyces hoynatensis TaxID=1141874 RepID=A0A3A9YSI6_9ACTN|nr:hypothetical protein [Streptomyces hoynatensis]RKN39011.1 hypothetical protein D7294_22790 [Streptomyces hoynatensis]
MRFRRRGGRREREALLYRLFEVIGPETERLAREGRVPAHLVLDISWDAVVAVVRERYRRGRDVHDLTVGSAASYRHLILECVRAREPSRTAPSREALREAEREQLTEEAAEADSPEERAALLYLRDHGFRAEEDGVVGLATALARLGRLDEEHLRAARAAYARRVERAVTGQVAWPDPQEVVTSLFGRPPGS